MRRGSTTDGQRPAAHAAGGAGAAWAEVSERERNFWRRAVAEERARLEFGAGTAVGRRAVTPSAH